MAYIFLYNFPNKNVGKIMKFVYDVLQKLLGKCTTGKIPQAKFSNFFV